MSTGPLAFYCLWQEERIRETLFDLLAKEDVCAVRLASSACCNLVSRRLFMRMHLTFTANTFTKASRVLALSRIGHHVEHLTFYLPHSDATFLPPLIHPVTGREISFLYTPHTSMASVLVRPKYSNTELGDVLTQQYQPLFHAATNVPSFLNAVKHLPNMRHLTIRCPGQDAKERYRRDIVDYALISLRISLERAPLFKLTKLSLSGVHPAAFHYLRHVPGFGAMPSAARRWRQIRKLYISVDTWDFYGPSPGLDHLKIIDDYVRYMAPHLEKLSFTWLSNTQSGGADSVNAGRKGPCPLALSGDPLFAPPHEGPKRLFNEVTGPMSPLPPAPCRAPMHFPRLRCLTLRNMTMLTPQLCELVESHKSTIREFDCENVSLVDGGSWEDGFAPLLSQVNHRGHSIWSRKGGSGSGSGRDDRAVTPTQNIRTTFYMAAGSDLGSPSSASSTVTYGPAAVASPDDVQIPSPSAAVTAVSRDLLELDTQDLEGYLGLPTDMTDMEEVPLLAAEDEVAEEYPIRMMHPPTIQEEDEDELERDDDYEDEEVYDEDEEERPDDVIAETGLNSDDLASDIAAAHEASLTFSTRLTKKRVHHRRRRHHTGHRNGEERSRSRHGHHQHQNQHRRRHEHSEADGGRYYESHGRSRSHSRSHSHSHNHGKESKSRDKDAPTIKEVPQEESRLRFPRPWASLKRSLSQKERPMASPPSPPRPPQPPLPPNLPLHFHPFSPQPPQPPQPRPLLAGQGVDDDDVFRPRTPKTPKSPQTLRTPRTPQTPPSTSHSASHSTSPLAARASPSAHSQTAFVSSAAVAPLQISAPILDADPTPVLLQPTVYNPRSPSSSSIYSHASGADDDGLSPIQRQIEQEEAQRRLAKQRTMAEDGEARASALRKAKEAVMLKLSREFHRRMGHEHGADEAGKAPISISTAAATAAAAAASVAMQSDLMIVPDHVMPVSSLYASPSTSIPTLASASSAAAPPSLASSLRWRGRLFGEPLSMATSDCHTLRSMESNSAVVPLIFSRA